MGKVTLTSNWKRIWY